MKYCNKCGNQLADNSLLCSRCGAATSIKICPGCGNAICFEDIYCKHCGRYQSTPVTGETATDVCEAQPEKSDDELNDGENTVSKTAAADVNTECSQPDANIGVPVSQPYNTQPQYRFPQAQMPQSPYDPAAFQPMPYNASPYQQLPFPPVMYAPNPMPARRNRLFKKGILPLFIWSLILVMLINPVGTTLSAISTFYLLCANADQESAETDLRKKKSLILNIAASAIDFLTFIALLIMAIKMK